MKIAVFSDIHGNALSLDVFFRTAISLAIDEYIFLGDMFNYYPDNKLVFEKLRNERVTCLLGNHDAMYLNDKIPEELVRKYNMDLGLQMDTSIIEFIQNLKPSLSRVTHDLKLFFCHGSPLKPLDGYVYPDSDLSIFSDEPYDYIFMGHTHRPFIKESNGIIFCNVGSVGQPRDNGSFLSFSVLDTERRSLKNYRIKVSTDDVLKRYGKGINNDVIGLLNRNGPLNPDAILLQ